MAQYHKQIFSVYHNRYVDISDVLPKDMHAGYYRSLGLDENGRVPFEPVACEPDTEYRPKPLGRRLWE